MALRKVDYTPEPYKPLEADIYPATLGAWEEVPAVDEDKDDAVRLTFVVELPDGGSRRVKRRYGLGAKSMFFLDRDLEALGVKLSEHSSFETDKDTKKEHRFVDIEGALEEAKGAKCMVEVAPREWQGTNQSTGEPQTNYSDDIKKVLPVGAVSGMSWK